MGIKNPFKKKEDLMVTSKNWTFYLDDYGATEEKFMNKILKDMLKERKKKGNNVEPEIVIKVKNKKEKS